MDKTSKIYVAGHAGMVGSAIARKLKEKGYRNIVGRNIGELDLTGQQAVIDFFNAEKPEYVFLAAAKVGGIQANNTYRAQFFYENLMIQNNIIHQSYISGVRKLLFLGSSCIYPKNCPQPIKESYLLTGPLESTNEPYAIAKISGIKMCENYFRQYGCNFISVMPTNLYGPNDNFNLETSHVLPALLRKVHLAKCLENNDWVDLRKDLGKRPIGSVESISSEESILEVLNKYGITASPHHLITRSIIPVTVTLWGTGSVYREFMHVDDMARACVKIMEEVDLKQLLTLNSTLLTFLNIGTGADLSIHDLAWMITEVVGFRGEILFDQRHPDGTPKKLLDISILNSTGFRPTYSLKEGIEQVYNDYVGEAV